MSLSQLARAQQLIACAVQLIARAVRGVLSTNREPWTNHSRPTARDGCAAPRGRRAPSVRPFASSAMSSCACPAAAVSTTPTCCWRAFLSPRRACRPPALRGPLRLRARASRAHASAQGGETPCTPSATRAGMQCNVLPLPEQQTQMALWSMASAPLLLSADLTGVPADSMAILTNPEVGALDRHTIIRFPIGACAGPRGRACIRPTAA